MKKIILGIVLLSSIVFAGNFEQKCEQGDSLYCSLIAAKAQNNNDVDKAIKYYTMSCDLGKSCSMLGVMLIEHTDRKDDANKYLEKGCELNEKMSCNLLGLFALKEKDFSTSVKYLEEACELGHAKSCAMVGEHYFKGKGVKRDRVKGTSLVKKSCDLKFEPACTIYNKIK
jgi:TPR repeat protein